MNYKNYKKYIVVSDNWRPMTFQWFGKKHGQFCYCDTERSRSPVAVQFYTYYEAKELIRKTIEYRKKYGYSIGEYYLMPVAPKIKITKTRK